MFVGGWCPCREELLPSPPLPSPFNPRWFSNFVAAADAVGIPVCVGLALVDPATGEALEEREFHTG